MNYSGKDLIALGFEPGPHFQPMLARANATGVCTYDALADLLPEEKVYLNKFANFLDEDNGATAAMDQLLATTHTVRKAALMPDACPAGVIPVGGVVACEDAIHPEFHSADVCCSMAISVFKRNVDPARVLDVAMERSHFGPTKRPRFDHKLDELDELLDHASGNFWLADLTFYGDRDFRTQGDGNHFFYVGDLNGQTVIVTHHGSRGFGANLFKRAKRFAKSRGGFIDANSDEGRSYWEALQIIRGWTKLNHFTIHEDVARALGVKISDRWWNEHNFVFRQSDGLYYHAKGATPQFDTENGLSLIPMNMAREILVCETGRANPDAIGFCPHGAGRNISRTKHLKTADPTEVDRLEVDVRAYSGVHDLSEMPSAYKDADQVIGAIEKYNLTRVVSRIQPLGSIMAGHIDWRSSR